MGLWQIATEGTELDPGRAPENESQIRPWSSADRFALGLLLVSLVVMLVWLVHPWYDPMNDASIYISTTRAMISGHGYSYLGVPFQLRPPGFPFLLAPLLQSVGTNFYAMNLYVASFGCAVVVLLFCWARPRLGWLLSLLCCLLVGTNPVFLQLCNQVMSDVPGVFFVLAGLIVARECERKPTLGMEILLGVCIGVSAYVRVLGLLLLPAVLLDRLLRHLRGASMAVSPKRSSLRRWLPLVMTTLVVIAPWGVRNQLSAVPTPADQLLNHSYTTALFHYDFGDPNSPLVSARDWGLRILERGDQISAGLASRLADSQPTPSRILVATLIFGIYFYWLVANPSTLGLFVLFSLGVTGSYFAYQDRLLLPIFVLLVPALTEALYRLVCRCVGRRWATGLVAGLLVAVVFADFSPRCGWTEIEARHLRMASVSRALERELPPDARLATVRGFHYAMLMDRPVYSLRWAHRLGEGSQGIEAVIDRHRINTLLLDPEVRLDRESEALLVERYGEGRRIAGVRVIRVRD